MTQENPDAVLFIRSDAIGRGSDELGLTLMMSFLHHLSEAENRPSFIIMMNSGVKLVTEGSDVLESLAQIESKGTTILACGTCLDFFGLRDSLKVGKASNMPEITATLLGAPKVITV